MPARNVQEPECSAGGLATAPSKARPQSGATLQTTVAIAGRSSLRQLVGLVGALHHGHKFLRMLLFCIAILDLSQLLDYYGQ